MPLVVGVLEASDNRLLRSDQVCKLPLCETARGPEVVNLSRHRRVASLLSDHLLQRRIIARPGVQDGEGIHLLRGFLSAMSGHSEASLRID